MNDLINHKRAFTRKLILSPFVCIIWHRSALSSPHYVNTLLIRLFPLFLCVCLAFLIFSLFHDRYIKKYLFLHIMPACPPVRSLANDQLVFCCCCCAAGTVGRSCQVPSAINFSYTSKWRSRLCRYPSSFAATIAMTFAANNVEVPRCFRSKGMRMRINFFFSCWKLPHH